MLEKDWFKSLLLPFLSFGDLHNLFKSNKVGKAVVQSLTAAWPDEIRELVRTWCKGPDEFLIIVNTDVSCTRFQEEGFAQHRYPPPIIKFQVDSLSFDKETGKVRGQPWSEVIPKNRQPQGLGCHQCCCYANDAKTEIFVCGGELLVPEGQDDGTLTWFYQNAIVRRDSRISGLFDLETRRWTELPSVPLPNCNSARAFRIGARVYIIGSGIPILWFDLDTMRWELGLDGSYIFPREALEDFEVNVIRNNEVIVAGGYWEGNVGYSREVFSLNMTSGLWTRLPDLPEVFALDEYKYSCSLSNGTMCIMNRHCWATLPHGGREWRMNPGLEGEGIKAVTLHEHMCKVFAGSTWIELPPYNQQNGHWLHINGMMMIWEDRSDYLVVK